jgi:hypothetical protein
MLARHLQPTVLPELESLIRGFRHLQGRFAQIPNEVSAELILETILLKKSAERLASLGSEGNFLSDSELRNIETTKEALEEMFILLNTVVEIQASNSNPVLHNQPARMGR